MGEVKIVLVFFGFLKKDSGKSVYIEANSCPFCIVTNGLWRYKPVSLQLTILLTAPLPLGRWDIRQQILDTPLNVPSKCSIKFNRINNKKRWKPSKFRAHSLRFGNNWLFWHFRSASQSESPSSTFCPIGSMVFLCSLIFIIQKKGKTVQNWKIFIVMNMLQLRFVSANNKRCKNKQNYK